MITQNLFTLKWLEDIIHRIHPLTDSLQGDEMIWLEEKIKSHVRQKDEAARIKKMLIVVLL